MYIGGAIVKEFWLKEEHIKLLRAAYVQWNNCETGAPEIDPKRPYGNSSVACDVAEILGLQGKTCPHCGESLDDKQEELLQLHRETETALKVVLSAQSFVPGLYCWHEDGAWQRGSWYLYADTAETEE